MEGSSIYVRLSDARRAEELPAPKVRMFTLLCCAWSNNTTHRKITLKSSPTFCAFDRNAASLNNSSPPLSRYPKYFVSSPVFARLVQDGDSMNVMWPDDFSAKTRGACSHHIILAFLNITDEIFLNKCRSTSRKISWFTFFFLFCVFFFCTFRWKPNKTTCRKKSSTNIWMWTRPLL